MGHKLLKKHYNNLFSSIVSVKIVVKMGIYGNIFQVTLRQPKFNINIYPHTNANKLRINKTQTEIETTNLNKGFHRVIRSLTFECLNRSEVYFERVIYRPHASLHDQTGPLFQ